MCVALEKMQNKICKIIQQLQQTYNAAFIEIVNDDFWLEKKFKNFINFQFRKFDLCKLFGCK